MVSEEDVRYVAELAHLELTEEERRRMLKDLNSILGYIDRLNELDTSNVEPMAQVASRYGDPGGGDRGMRNDSRDRVCRAKKRCATLQKLTACSSRCRR